ncbi:MAG: hypothetical protein ACRDFR_06625 [Candidatus Limnocylindria bacterium]
MSGHIRDVLGAASLLTAVIALLYSLWYPEIRRAIEARRRPQLADRGPEIRLVRSTLVTKAIPLIVATVLQMLVFGPDAIVVIANSLQAALESPGAASYDSVQAAFLAVYVLSVILAMIAAAAAWQLWRKLRYLESP